MQKLQKNSIARFQEKLLKDKQPGRTVKTLNFLREDNVVFEIIIRYQYLNKFELIVAIPTYLPTHLLTDLPTYLPTYVPICYLPT